MSTAALDCPCGDRLEFDDERGWPSECPTCETGVIAPLPGPQTTALASPADVILFGGGVFGGKSYGSALFARKYVHDDNATVLVLRKERTMLLGAGGLFDKFQNVMGDLGPEVRQSSMYFDMRFHHSGAVVEFGGCRHVGDFAKYEGNEYAIMVWDEAQHLDFRVFSKLMQRNRSPDGCKTSPRFLLTCNPPQPSEPGYWIREFIDWYIGPDGYPISERCGQLRYFTVTDNRVEWVDSEWRDEDGNPPKSFTFIQALASDNPVGLANNPTYMASIRAQSEVDQDRLGKGNWNARHGAQMFGRGRLGWLDSLPDGLKDAHRLRYWDLGGGLNDSDTRNGLGGARLVVAACPKCDGERFLGDKPCPICNAAPDGKGGIRPFRPRHKVEEDNADGVLEAVWVDDVVWRQGELADLEDLMMEVARMDGSQVPQYIEEERGGSGKVATHHYQKLMSSLEVVGDRVTGKKHVRAKPLVGLAEKGLLFVVRGSEDVRVRKAFQTFGPDGSGEFKDIIDSVAGGYGAYIEHEWPSDFFVLM